MRFMQDEYAHGALALKEIGVDCVEIHCAHGGATMGCSTISPFYNRRTDEYGGSWENRLRFNVEAIQKMRAAVGPDYPIFARIDGDELLGPRGITIENCCEFIVPALENAGVDCFDVSQGSILHAPQGITIPLYYPRGCFIHFAAAVKQVTSKPVIGVGNIFDLDMAELFLEEGKADIIWMGRQLTSDPETPKKYFEGRTEDIRECIGCLGGCGRPCSVNYDIQDEPIPLTPAEKVKRVLVVGGGVAGMEAARIAALRGHKVTLFEKAPELGGMVKVLGLNPLTGEIGNFARYLSGQMRKLKVDVRVSKEATAADVDELKPDAVILATGSADSVPEIARGKPGVMTFSDASRHPRAIGHRVIVWGVFGSELAIHLAETGHDVVLIAVSGESSLGSDISGSRRFWLLRKLTDLNLVRESPEAVRVTNPKVYFNTTVLEMGAGTVRIKGKDGAEETIPYDTIIPVQRFGERQVDESLLADLQGKAHEVYKIGDCAKVRGIKDAIWTANEVARNI
jgi:thioredoxin reductase